MNKKLITKKNRILKRNTKKGGMNVSSFMNAGAKALSSGAETLSSGAKYGAETLSSGAKYGAETLSSRVQNLNNMTGFSKGIQTLSGESEPKNGSNDLLHESKEEGELNQHKSDIDDTKPNESTKTPEIKELNIKTDKLREIANTRKEIGNVEEQKSNEIEEKTNLMEEFIISVEEGIKKTQQTIDNDPKLKGIIGNDGIDAAINKLGNDKKYRISEFNVNIENARCDAEEARKKAEVVRNEAEEARKIAIIENKKYLITLFRSLYYKIKALEVSNEMNEATKKSNDDLILQAFKLFDKSSIKNIPSELNLQLLTPNQSLYVLEEVFKTIQQFGESTNSPSFTGGSFFASKKPEILQSPLLKKIIDALTSIQSQIKSQDLKNINFDSEELVPLIDNADIEDQIQKQIEEDKAKVSDYKLEEKISSLPALKQKLNTEMKTIDIKSLKSQESPRNNHLDQNKAAVPVKSPLPPIKPPNIVLPPVPPKNIVQPKPRYFTMKRLFGKPKPNQNVKKQGPNVKREVYNGGSSKQYPRKRIKIKTHHKR